MTIDLKATDFDDSAVLGGRVRGERARPAIERTLKEGPENCLVILDFLGVELITASYFLAAFGWIWRSEEMQRRDVFPALQNLTVDSREEISLALRAGGLRALLVETAGKEIRKREYLNLEPLEEETLGLVELTGQATAADLFRKDPRIQPTAWSNRLALLHTHRLLSRRKQGRQLIYSVTWR